MCDYDYPETNRHLYSQGRSRPRFRRCEGQCGGLGPIRFVTATLAAESAAATGRKIHRPTLFRPRQMWQVRCADGLKAFDRNCRPFYIGEIALGLRVESSLARLTSMTLIERLEKETGALRA